MQIKSSSSGTAAIYDADIMAGEYDHPGVVFNEDGIATVRKDVGEALAEKYPSLEPVADDDADDSDDDSGETGDSEGEE